MNMNALLSFINIYLIIPFLTGNRKAEISAFPCRGTDYRNCPDPEVIFIKEACEAKKVFPKNLPNKK